MQEFINLYDGGSFPLKPGLPADFRGHVLQGSKAASAQTSLGLVVLQDYQRTNFAIRLGIYKFLRLVRSVFQPPVFPTGSFLALKNDFRAQINGIVDVKLSAGHFNFIHNAGENFIVEFKAGKEYQILDVSCSFDI
ncbi:MAG: hypothetical protein M3N30_10185 [Bacteroidota bacterium]|nr:hypothetical protein [Bacteroidota bacterium]